MIITDHHIVLLENRPVLQDAIEHLLQASIPGNIDDRYNSFDDLPKKYSQRSLLLLAVHLMPVDVPIPSECEGAASVVYGENFTPNCANWWIKRGAIGVWDLRDSFESVREGLLGVLDGKTLTSPSVKHVLEGVEHKFGMHLLSKRELQVAKRLVQGFSTRDVAKEQDVTEGTIKNQRKAVYRKLGIIRSSQLPLAMGNGFAVFRK